MTRKKLIEVALPLDAINAESSREKSIRHGHPSTLHLWWARRPLAACRAVLFTSLVDDPEQPDAPKELLEAIDRLLPDASGERSRRERLFDFIGELVMWDNTTNEHVLNIARQLICAATAGAPPPVLDPFCGGGSIPLEAQRLGLEVYASDLNPVAVLITKALVEIPPKFAGRPPVNPDARAQIGQGAAWRGAAGLAADVRWFGKWIRDRALERIGHLYPKGPNGETVIAWLWARTVKCPNPACAAQMPLIHSFWLSTKAGREAWLEPVVDALAKSARFEVRTGNPADKSSVDAGTKAGRADFRCMFCGQTADGDHIKAEGMAGRLGQWLLAVVAEGAGGRTYTSADTGTVPDFRDEEKDIVHAAREGFLSGDTPRRLTGGTCHIYGLTTWGSLFTPRQLLALTTFADLVGEARELAMTLALGAGLPAGDVGIADGGTGAKAYAEAIATYLAFGIDKNALTNCTLATWQTNPDRLTQAFSRQALPMTWDFAEANPLSDSGGGFVLTGRSIAEVLERLPLNASSVTTRQLDAASTLNGAITPMICTDPPYYDNISYADLSDFFYVWLRKTMSDIFPDVFSTLLTPKAPELVAAAYRFDGDKRAAEQHFEEGLAKTFALMRHGAPEDFPLTLYYAFKQAEGESNGSFTLSHVSTGWQTMLEGLLRAGFRIVGTWPMRTELVGNLKKGTNALASSIVLVCRPRPTDAPIATRREFLASLRDELPEELRILTGHGTSHPVSPVDLAQATIGPGMAVFSRYSKVIEASGDAMSVRTALQLINQAIDDYFTEVEGELDSDTRFCVAWFSEFGFDSGSFGQADVLARAKDVGIAALARDGVLESGANKVRLLPLTRYSDGWESYDPAADRRPTIWEACHYLVAAVMDTSGGGGEMAAARLARRLGGLADGARDLAYRLYSICERKGWAEPALGYNALVASWPEIQKQAAALTRETQAGLI
jgi:putative DNA methylase